VRINFLTGCCCARSHFCKYFWRSLSIVFVYPRIGWVGWRIKKSTFEK
jgi:hypothetical protein